MKIIIQILALILLTGCVSTSQPKKSDITVKLPQVKSKADSKYDKKLLHGFQLIQDKRPMEAIVSYFNPVIAHFEQNIAKNDVRYYSARTQMETFFYLILSAADMDKGQLDGKTKTEVISSIWSEAYYLKGAAYVEARNYGEAEIWIKKAVELSPLNSPYLSELGHIHHRYKQWASALEIFHKSVAAAAYSPEQEKTRELTRAMRGEGYSLVELGRLDEAEEKYNECLKIDKDDKTAQGEITYIQNLRLKSY